jgi:hypothetical protein
MQHIILSSKKMTSQNNSYEIKLVPYNKTCSRIEKLDKVMCRKINISFVLLTNANSNLEFAHELKYQ